jgi:hypothetical protein
LTRTSSLSAAVALLALLAGTVAAAASYAAPAPPFRTAKAVFRVVVEGSGDAHRRVDGDGSNGPCHIVSHTESDEQYEYGRGQGLSVVFTRFVGVPRSPVLMKRVGRRSPRVTFNVRGWYRDTASGSATRSGDPVLCQPLTDMAGDESECNRRIRRPLDMALTWDGRKIGLEMADPELTRLPGAGCGSNSIETMSGWPVLGWMGFPALEKKRLPVARIFVARRPFKVELTSGFEEQRVDSPNPVFQGAALDSGRHNAVVRFIRVRR